MTDKSTGIRFRTIIEILGKPKEHIESTLRKYVDKLREEDDYILIKEDFSESVQHENLWSTFTELEIVCKDIPKIIAFCFEYMPSSVEIIKPESFEIENHVITGFLNDLQARLHNFDMIVKKLRAENDIIKRNMRLSIENLITILLKINSMDIEQLSKYTGINKDELIILLNNMVSNKKIKIEDTTYKLIE